jgi:D-methionine transport system substrate-binding protein
MGVYSKKHKSLADIKSGAKVALPNDPSNLARALLVLQQAGLVKVKEG